MEWEWVARAAERDLGQWESALARPQHLAISDPEADVAGLAAADAFGIARNHPFVDGNKRTALVVLELFLEINGHALATDDADCVAAMLALAAGDLGEGALAAWVRQHLAPQAP